MFVEILILIQFEESSQERGIIIIIFFFIYISMDNSDKQTAWENIGTVTVIVTVHLF